MSHSLDTLVKKPKHFDASDLYTYMYHDLVFICFQSTSYGYFQKCGPCFPCTFFFSCVYRKEHEDSVTRFFTSGFFHEASSSGPLFIVTILIFSKIRNSKGAPHLQCQRQRLKMRKNCVGPYQFTLTVSIDF